MDTNKGHTTMNTAKRPQRSTCNGCSRAIFKMSVNNATDSKKYDNTYHAPQHTKVWLDRESKSMCGGSNYDTAHTTDKEMTGK